MNPLSPETLFRITFGLLWLVYFGARLYYQRRIKSGLEYTRVNARQEILLFRLFALGQGASPCRNRILQAFFD